MKAAVGLGGLLFALCGLPPESLAASSTTCVSAVGLFSSAMFRKYSADANWRGPWRAPDVRSGQAHLFRTVLREEGVGPPDFAGRIKVVSHGCGAGLTCPMFVDLATGRVTFVRTLQSAEWNYEIADSVEKATAIHDTRLVYRRDSRLLVTLGTRNEDMRLTGATLYEWRDSELKLIRFIPQRALCEGGKGR